MLVTALFMSLLLAIQTDVPAEAAPAEAAISAEPAADDVEICRKRPVENPKARGRTKMVKICKTREEWKAYSTRKT